MKLRITIEEERVEFNHDREKNEVKWHEVYQQEIEFNKNTEPNILSNIVTFLNS